MSRARKINHNMVNSEYKEGIFVNKNSRFEVAYQEGDALIKGLKMVLVDKETGETT